MNNFKQQFMEIERTGERFGQQDNNISYWDHPKKRLKVDDTNHDVSELMIYDATLRWTLPLGIQHKNDRMLSNLCSQANAIICFRKPILQTTQTVKTTLFPKHSTLRYLRDENT